MDKPLYTCPIDAEPLYCYKRGGYHPIKLGIFPADGRYKILHKLGWGGYSTVWAARDQREGNYVAVKIYVSEEEDSRARREHNVLKKLPSTGHAGSQHVLHLIDHFDMNRPSGTHLCLVSELLGPSVSDLIDARFRDGRLPGKLAKVVATQALSGLDFLHHQQIAHGGVLPFSRFHELPLKLTDLHIRNLAFGLVSMDNVPESKFVKILGTPEIGQVSRNDGQSLDPGVPEYIVRPAKISSLSVANTIKIIDFGESFSSPHPPQTLHTPLTVRAPEVIFGDFFDHCLDLWTMGCILFEIFVGQPPFGSSLITPKIFVDQMQELTNEALPERWRGLWETMGGNETGESPGPALQEWLEEMYFDGERKADLTREDIVELGRVVRRLLRIEPSARASVRDVLDDSWVRSAGFTW